jgi:hypothetical protein
MDIEPVLAVLYPLSLENALSRLPKEPTGVETAVQGLLLKHVSDMRYNTPVTTQAKRPRSQDKLPSASAYSCPAQEKVVEDSSDDEHSPAASHQKTTGSPSDTTDSSW